MPADAEMVTVFRSADDDAEEDARAVNELLAAQGISSVLLDDSAPGVPAGVWEVQVPSADSARAEQLIAESSLPDEELVEVDKSPDLDTVAVFHAHGGTTSEMEAIAVKSMLEASGIAALIVGDSVLPNLSFDVHVAREHASRAQQLIAEAQAVGAQAADDEEQATESPLNP
jgi:hypothetical protein